MDRLQALRCELKAYFVERDAIIDGALAGLIAGEHVLLLGPVGTAKSLLARVLCERIEGATYFGWLLTKFSTPEELFGPVSLRGLEADEFRRITADKLPTAHIAFLDEVFKANSAILNSLLALLNERVYHNGREAQKTPLLTLFAASNELPEEGELAALYDRFLLRFELDYIADDDAFIGMLELPEILSGQTTLGLTDLRALQARRGDVKVPESLLRDLADLRARLNVQELEVSDRRYRKSIEVLRAYAVLDGRDRVSSRDLEHLGHLLWNDPEDRPLVLAAIDAVIGRFEVAASDLEAKAEQQRNYALRYWPTEGERMSASVESLAKLRRLIGKAETLVETTENRDDDSHARVVKARDRVAEILEAVLASV